MTSIPPLTVVIAAALAGLLLFYVFFLPSWTLPRARAPLAMVLALCLGELFVLFLMGGIVTLVIWRLGEMVLLTRMQPLAGLLRPVLRQPLAPRGRGPRRNRYAQYREPMAWNRGPSTY